MISYEVCFNMYSFPFSIFTSNWNEFLWVDHKKLRCSEDSIRVYSLKSLIFLAKKIFLLAFLSCYSVLCPVYSVHYDKMDRIYWTSVTKKHPISEHLKKFPIIMYNIYLFRLEEGVRRRCEWWQESWCFSSSLSV